MTERLYSQSEFNKIFKHISPKTLMHWIFTGVIGWKSETYDGRGRHREFNIENLYNCGLVEELTTIGFPLEIIKAGMITLDISTPFDLQHRERHFKLQKISENSDKLFVVWKFVPGRQQWKKGRPFKIDILRPAELLENLTDIEESCSFSAINLGKVKARVDTYINQNL
ncbi:MAG: hypothetical protein ACLFUU_10780 [Desulfobacteraceae bacterium]